MEKIMESFYNGLYRDYYKDPFLHSYLTKGKEFETPTGRFGKRCPCWRGVVVWRPSQQHVRGLPQNWFMGMVCDSFPKSALRHLKDTKC